MSRNGKIFVGGIVLFLLYQWHKKKQDKQLLGVTDNGTGQGTYIEHVPTCFSFNNPGNIRQNHDVTFQHEIYPSSNLDWKDFTNIEYGYRAMAKILRTYVNNFGLVTIDMMINRYAPSNENDTEGYVQWVGAQSGLNPYVDISQIINSEDIFSVINAMVIKEQGQAWYDRYFQSEDLINGIQLASN